MDHSNQKPVPACSTTRECWSSSAVTALGERTIGSNLRRSSFGQGPFDTFLVGGDTAEVTSMKFSNDGKHMLLSTANSWLYVLDAFEGHKVGM